MYVLLIEYHSGERTLNREARKLRITSTVDPNMVAALDRFIKKVGLSSRSKAVEAALSYWLAGARRRGTEREIEVYYRSLTPAEKDEDREWARFASRQAGRLRG
jgi:metal-responsive CopG/Arc/MetJ family transcriptional regulator